MLDSLPDSARLWLVPLDRTLDAEAADALRQRVAAWLPSWASHGRPVRAEAAVLAGRALAVGAVISQADVNAGVSGCGIDTMEHAVDEALAAADVGRAPALGVLARDAAGDWQALSRPAFRALVRDGRADAQTPVLDVTADTVGALRQRGAVRPAGEAWTGRAFRIG